MNGAESLIRSLVGAGVEVCFANPGTSEMHMVQGIDAVPEMRAVLALFEGVCTGAADGYGRMTGKPATTLLHLGPGLGNGIANLHNARRNRTPLINLVGDHASYHVKYDAPLTSDLEAIARGVSAWVRTSASSVALAQDGVDAVVAALTPRPGSKGAVATLGVPADASWGDADGLATFYGAPGRPKVDAQHAANCARELDAHSILLLDGAALQPAGMRAAGRIAAATGCQVRATTFTGRIDSGAGLPPIRKMPYFPEDVLDLLKDVSKLVMVGADLPVSFFAYRTTPSVLVPDSCRTVPVAGIEYDLVDCLEHMAEALNAPQQIDLNARGTFTLPSGDLNPAAVYEALGAVAPEGSIFCADSGPGGGALIPLMNGEQHTFLSITGGAIGQGGPVAVGAAVACPDQAVFALLGDGGAMYTNQAFWTQAREGQNVTSVVFNNSAYGILQVEYARLGINEPGKTAASLFDLGDPVINWAQLAQSQGIPGRRCTTADEFSEGLTHAMAEDGPHLLEVMMTGFAR